MPRIDICPVCRYFTSTAPKDCDECPAGDKLKHALSNLLATIHHDGGHYEVRHGTLKAVEDAKELVIKERELFDAYKYQMSGHDRR